MYKKPMILLLSTLLLSSQTAWASPSGLNNIPTTDVAGNKTLVIQGWFTVGDEAKPIWMLGSKYGILDRVEIGVDSKLGSEDAGPVTVQTKLKLHEFDFGLAGLIGVEGISFDDEIVDNIVPYAVLSQKISLPDDLYLFRINGGYGFQKDNYGMFFGVDRAFEVFSQELVLRSDIKQVNDGNDMLVSGGFLLTLPFNFVIESWLSIPTEDGKEETFTLKLNYVIKF